jgi:hypothetical protein
LKHEAIGKHAKVRADEQWSQEPVAEHGPQTLSHLRAEFSVRRLRRRFVAVHDGERECRNQE